MLVDPYTAFDWPERLDADAHWFMSPSLTSLYGTPAWDALSETQQRRLSFYELVNFFSLAIAGERLLVHKMAPYLYHTDYAAHTPYLHHFLEEENRHMVWFGTFCQRYAGKVYSARWYPLPSNHDDSEEEFRFWVSVLAFEEVGDAYNQAIAADETIHPLSREINRAHHREETRHLAFGRLMVREVWERHSSNWAPEVKARVQDYVANYLLSEFHDYFNPAVYIDAGLPEPYRLRADALACDAAKVRFRDVSASCAKVLVDAGVLAAPPTFAAF
jgi:hypothetical protein